MPPLLVIPATLVGLCLGSFVTTAALRSAHGEQALAGRSHCDGCGVSLGFARTTPVLAYVALRGVCADCGARIDPLHLAGEVAGGLIVGLAFYIAPCTRVAPLAALGLLLLASAVYDAKTRKLPDLLTFAVAALGAVLDAEQSMATLWLGLVAHFGQMANGDSASSAAHVPDSLAVVRVEPGESIQDVAARVAPDAPATQVVQRIRELNDLGSPTLVAGQTLIAPVG